MRITTPAVDALGELIGAATAVLGALAEIHGLRVEVSDPSPLEAQARVRAWSRAHDKARQLADLAGTRLGHAVEVHDETSWHLQGPVPMYPDLGTHNVIPVETRAASVDFQGKVRFARFPDDDTSA